MSYEEVANDYNYEEELDWCNKKGLNFEKFRHLDRMLIGSVDDLHKVYSGIARVLATEPLSKEHKQRLMFAQDALIEVNAILISAQRDIWDDSSEFDEMIRNISVRNRE